MACVAGDPIRAPLSMHVMDTSLWIFARGYVRVGLHEGGVHLCASGRGYLGAECSSVLWAGDGVIEGGVYVGGRWVGGELLGKAWQDSQLSAHLAATTHRCAPSAR